ncbi:MAG: hypothetical protein ACK5LF_21475 [Bacteroides xylanisolvens]
MGIERIDAYICTCYNCGETYENGGYIPAMAFPNEIDDITRNDGEWIKEGDNYYCPECYKYDGDDKLILSEERTKLKDKNE